MAGINGEDPDTLFLKFNIYDNMCNLKREDGVPIRDFIHEFETKYFKLREDMRDEECLQVKIKFCNQKFIFGNGKTVVSKKRVTVPCWIGEMRERVCIKVVVYNIPLLLNRKAMKEAGMVLDFRG